MTKIKIIMVMTKTEVILYLFVFFRSCFFFFFVCFFEQYACCQPSPAETLVQLWSESCATCRVPQSLNGSPDIHRV